MHTHLVGTGSSSKASSADKSLPRDDLRERLIDAALELFARQGFDATDVDQIAAVVGLSAAEFRAYFASTKALLTSVADEVAYVTTVELKNVPRGVAPEHALLQAGTAALAAVVEGRSELTLDRLLAVARTVTTTRNLQRTLSAARKRVIAQPLADCMGVDPTNRRLQHALTMWSAVAASAYTGVLGTPDRYESAGAVEIQQRMLTGVMESFHEVLGRDPTTPE